MLRYKYDKGDLTHITYGASEVCGFFLSAFDKRLQTKNDKDDSMVEENQALKQHIGTGDGSGRYFYIHTGYVIVLGHLPWEGHLPPMPVCPHLATLLES